MCNSGTVGSIYGLGHWSIDDNFLLIIILSFWEKPIIIKKLKLLKKALT